MRSESDSMWSRWEEVDRLFDAALDRPADERRSFVESECGTDSELLASVLHLLAIAESSDNRLEIPDSSFSQEFVEELADQAEVPDQIGRYSILRELGRGGMGTVYLAEYEGDDYRQQVALKVLRRGLDTEDILGRFVTERQILAKLRHPNIARLYDGGSTPNGRPYLAMEYVEGKPITDYCDEERLSIRKRLRLMLQVADAVNAAHTNLIVHRDLKPSNILVTQDKHVKLLDFGIAKILDPEDGSDYTRTGSYVLTPDHASPEQLKGEPVTTATDVYQLGVLLFRLLTGKRPFGSPAGSVLEPEELAKRTDIPKPSSTVLSTDEGAELATLRSTSPAQLRRSLRGDLDTIVGKALDTEPSRRYSSGAGLVEDIRRFLDGRPISARPDSFGYQTRKFLRRHPWVAPVALVALAVLGIYITTLVRYTDRLEVERNTAQLEAARAEEVQRFLVELFSSANPFVPTDTLRGRRITVVEALDLGVKSLGSSLETQPGARASILAAIADVYEDLGVYDRAQPLREEAMDIQISLYGPTSRPVRDSLGSLAAIHNGLGELDGATELYEKWLELAVAAEPADRAEIAEAHTQFGWHLGDLTQSERSHAQFAAAVVLAAEGGVPPQIEVESIRGLAETQHQRNELADSVRSARQAVELADLNFGSVSATSALAQSTLASCLSGLGKHKEADATFRFALENLEHTLGADHMFRLVTLGNYAILKIKSGDFVGAERVSAEVADIGERVYGENHQEFATALQNHASALVRLGRYDEAIPLFHRAARIYGDQLADNNFRKALPFMSLSDIYLKRHQFADAENAMRQAIPFLEQGLPADHWITAIGHCRLARALMKQTRLEEAEPHFSRAVTNLLATPAGDPGYRQTCLTAAADFYRPRGDSERVNQIEEALASIDSDAQVAAAVSTD